jgi:ribosomal protein S8
MRVLKKRKYKDYPLCNPTPRVPKKRSRLELVPKKEAIIPEVVKHSSLATASPATIKAVRHQENILRYLKSHPFTKMPNPFVAPSPFQIFSRKEMKDDYLSEPFIRDYGHSTVEITGRKLFVYDQGTLLALLKLREMCKCNVFITDEKEICKLMHLKNPSLDSKEAVWKSLERLKGVNVKIDQWDKDEKIRKKLSTTLLGILNDVNRNETNGELTIIMDIFFTEVLETKRFASIDAKLRASLSGDIAKMLYVFLQRQKGFYLKPHKYECMLETLCNNINLRIDFLFLTRQKIKKAFEELKDKGYVSRWEITDKDYVRIYGVPKPETKKKDGPTIKDDYDDITKTFRNQYIRRWRNGDENLSIAEENCMVIAAKRYMEEVLKDWKRYDVDSRAVHLDRPKLGVIDVFDAIEASARTEGYEPHAGWLKSDKTINERIPWYFTYAGQKIN